MRNNDESANLDFLRAYAVLTVYFGHLLQTFHIERIFGPVTIYDLGQTGVLIFFVHTSLVLMLSLARLRVTGRTLFTAFYIRRAFRIYPLSIVTLLVMLVVHAPDFSNHVYSWPGWQAVLSNLALVQNLTGSPSYPAVLWSLPYEVQMYIVLPLLFVFLRRFPSWWVPVCLWILDVAAILLMLKLRVREIPALLQYTPCFLAGIIGYRLWSVARMDLRFWGWPIVITSCLALRVLAEATAIRYATTLSPWFVCLFLGCAVPQFRELGRGWVRTFAAMMAKYSYGIYLSHSIVFWIAFILLKGTPFWLQGGACLALSVLLPLAMYHGIEKPMISLGVDFAGASAKHALASELAPRRTTA